MLRTSRADGFSLTELIVAVSVLTIMASVAVPTTLTVTETMKVSGVAREFEREMQAARLKAVQSNRTLRVRFNCPATGQYRRVEFMNSAIDSSPSRCAETL